MTYSTISRRTRPPAKRERPRRERPELFYRRERSNFIDPRSYVTKGGRVRLFGADYTRLKASAEQRAYERQNIGSAAACECGCGKPAPWNLADLSHKKHGARKSDELSEVDWMRHECHMKSHNCGGKPIAVTKKSLKEKAF